MAGWCINTFVSFDLETTGLPWQEHNRTKITELALVAVSRENLLGNAVDVHGLPRVTHKLILCVNPSRMIQPGATQVTGLDNEILEHEKTFDQDACDMISLFLSRQKPPVCLVAHNGMKFDFPIIQSEIKEVGKVLSDDILCVDSYTAFRELFSTLPLNMLPLYIQKQAIKSHFGVHRSYNMKDTMQEYGTIHAMGQTMSTAQQINEMTPKQIIPMVVSPPQILEKIKAKKQLFTDISTDSTTPLESFKLPEIYRFLSGRVVTDSHRAENDALTLIACIAYTGQDFLQWADAHAIPFNSVRGLR